jgi:predicted dehydrogenase
LTSIGIGIVGAGYMGKAHAVAMSAVAAVFDTAQRPSLEILSAISESEAQEKACAFGFRRGTADWRALVEAPEVEAVVIASLQWTHRTSRSPPLPSASQSCARSRSARASPNAAR